MQTEDFFDFIVKEVHTVVVATTDERGLPVTCAVDIMDRDENSLYFLTANGKNLYKRLKSRGYLALTGVKGNDTMSSAALSLRGKVTEADVRKVKELFDKNPYMYEIYPDEESRKVIRAFRIYEGAGDWFDLSVKPIKTAHFEFGEGKR